MASGELQSHVMHLVDFGPHPYSNTQKHSANDILQLQLPPKGVKAQNGVQGLGLWLLCLNGSSLTVGWMEVIL